MNSARHTSLILRMPYFRGKLSISKQLQPGASLILFAHITHYFQKLKKVLMPPEAHELREVLEIKMRKDREKAGQTQCDHERCKISKNQESGQP